jgi:hypothetical protein
MRPGRIALIVVALGVLVAVVMWASDFLKIDSCLDRGGAWNYERGTCEGARSQTKA